MHFKAKESYKCSMSDKSGAIQYKVVFQVTALTNFA